MDVALKEYEYSDLERCRLMKLKQSDVDEFTILSPHTSMSDIISDSIAVSEISYLVLLDNNVEAMFGIRTDQEGFTIVWFMSTDKINLFRHKFLRVSKNIVDLMLKEYSPLTNIVSAENETSIKYLKYLGFEFGEEPVMINNRVFYSFWKHRGQNV